MVSFHNQEYLNINEYSAKKPGKLSYWLGGGVLLMLSIAMFLVNTRHGIGVLPDSVRYMGLGYVPFDAPLYPWLLDIAMLTGLTVEKSAVVLGFIFVCANTALIWLVLTRSAGKFVYAIVGTAIIIFSPQFVSLHSLALSEPTFLFFLLLTLYTILLYTETQNRAWLIVSGITLGLATLARFTAPPLGAAIVLALLLDPRYFLVRRFSDAIIFASVSACIFLSWVLVSHLVADQSVGTIGREFSFHGNMELRQWLRSLESLAQWLLPKQVPLIGRIVVFVATAGTAAWFTLKYIRETWGHLGRAKAAPLLVMILGLFFFFYLAFVRLATMIEANLSLTPRYAFPAFVTTVIMLTIVLAHYSGKENKPKLIHRGLVAFFILVLGSNLIRTTVRSQEAYQMGTGFASVTWSNSPTMQKVRELPDNAVIYSNGPDAISYLLRRRANLVPQHFELRTGLDDQRSPYDVQLQNLRDDMAKENAYLVIFDNVDWRFYLATEAELKKSLPLLEFKSESDGRIYSMSKATQKE